jgi:hypothetical protein
MAQTINPAQSLNLSGINLSDYGYGDVIDIAANPASPAPGARVTVVIDSNTTNLDLSQIVWSVNGKEVQNGIGIKSYTFTAGQLGQKTTVSVKITTPQGAIDNQSISVTPGEVDMIWQTDTYTPPFYEGKAMYTTQSAVQVTAIPHMLGSNGAEINPANLLYKWTRDGSVIGDQSGYGRNTLTFSDTDLPRETDVSVQVTSYDGSQTSQGFVAITPIPPKVISYEDNPRLGVLSNKALVGDVTMKDQEITLTAYPFFFSAGLNGANMKYEWDMNGQPIDNNSSNHVVLRTTTDQEGNALVDVTAKQNNFILQYADAQTMLYFNNKQN